jgi:hypothetical protein
MSGYANINAYADPNVLLQTQGGQAVTNIAAQQIANQYAPQRNQLFISGQQQTQGENEIEMMARAAQGLLALPQEQRAAAYGPAVANLQRNGFAKNAPTQYPGDATLQQVAAMGLTLPQQYQYGVVTAPGLQQQIDRILGGGQPGTDGGGAPGAPVQGARGSGSATRAEAEGGPPAAGSPGAAVAQRVHDFWLSKGYSEPQIAGILAGGPGSESDFTPSVFGDNRTSYGLYQHHGPRYAAMQQRYGTATPSEAQQNEYAAWEISPQGPLANVGVALAAAKTPEEAATIWTRDFGVPGDKTEIGRRARGAGRYVGLYGGSGTVPGAPGGPSVVVGGTTAPPPPGGAPGPYTGGGIGSVLNPAGKPASPVAAIQSGMQSAQAQPAPPGTVLTAGPGAGTPPAAPLGVEPPPEPGWGTAPPGSYNYGGGPAAAAPPVVPQPPRNPVLPAQPNVTPSPPQQQQAQPAQEQLPPSGVNSVQYQQAAQLQRQALALDALVDPTGRAKLLAAGLRQQAQLLLQTDSVTQLSGGRQFHPLTGKIDLPGPPRFAEGEATWDGQKWTQTLPGQQGVPGRWAVGPSGEQFFPASSRPGASAYTQQAKAYDADIPLVKAASAAGQTAQNSMIQLNELAGLVGDGRISSGPEGHFRSQVAAYMEQHGFSPETIKSWTGDASGSDAQLLQKLATATVGAAAKADLGSNVGIQSLELYQNANPGITMLDDANKRVTNMIRVTRALTDDYTMGLQKHFNTNQNAFLHDQGYNEPVSVFNAKWQEQNNPQVGAAAIGILNGDDYSNWAARLGSPEEAFRAAQLVARIDPNAMVNTASGRKSVKDILAHRDAP